MSLLFVRSPQVLLLWYCRTSHICRWLVAAWWHSRTLWRGASFIWCTYLRRLQVGVNSVPFLFLDTISTSLCYLHEIVWQPRFGWRCQCPLRVDLGWLGWRRRRLIECCIHLQIRWGVRGHFVRLLGVNWWRKRFDWASGEWHEWFHRLVAQLSGQLFDSGRRQQRRRWTDSLDIVGAVVALAGSVPWYCWWFQVHGGFNGLGPRWSQQNWGRSGVDWVGVVAASTVYISFQF